MEASSPPAAEVFFERIADRDIECVRYPSARAGAPPLVFLHDGIGSVAMWRGFPAEVAAATGAAAFVYSRHGNGWSSTLARPLEVDYMHTEALEGLPELLDRQSIDAPILIGQSDGASIALIHAGGSRRPVRGLVLEAPHVFVEDLTIASIEAAKRTFLETGLKDRLRRHHRDPEASFFGWNDVWLRPEFRDWNIERYLSAVTCPVLALQGEDDEYGTLAQIEAIERQVSGPFQKIILRDCGHTPHRDQHQRTLRAICDFVAAVEGMYHGR